MIHYIICPLVLSFSEVLKGGREVVIIRIQNVMNIRIDQKALIPIFERFYEDDISLVPAGRVLTDTDELEGYNVDWLRTVKGQSRLILYHKIFYKYCYYYYYYYYF